MIATERHAARSWLLLGAWLLASTAAHAEPSAAQKAEADALFQEGKKLMLQKRWPEACRKLEASQKLEPAGGTLLNLALCHEEEGKLATAWVEFGDALIQAKADKKNDRIKIARDHIERLEPKLPRLTLAAQQRAPGLKVVRSGVALSDASLGTAIPVDPGEHVVQATAPGYRPFEGKIQISAGESKTFTIPPLERLPEPATSAPPPPPPPPPPAPKTTRRNVGLIVGGVGAVSLAVGAFFGVRTFSKKRESDDACPTPTTCSPEGVRSNDEAYTAASIANITVGAGLLGLGVGAYLVLTSGPSRPSSASVSVSPVLDPAGGGLSVRGRW